MAAVIQLHDDSKCEHTAVFKHTEMYRTAVLDMASLEAFPPRYVFVNLVGNTLECDSTNGPT